MSDYILNDTTDSGSLDFPKSDAIVLPPSVDPTQVVISTSWNALNQATRDIRKNILSGSVFGFGTRYANAAAVPAIPGMSPTTSDYLYVKSDGTLVQHKRDNTEFSIAPATVTSQIYYQLEENDTRVPAVTLPTLVQGDVLVYARSNGSSIAGQRRSQLVVRWGTDNSDTVIAEGPAY
jgi:hypothetical protein